MKNIKKSLMLMMAGLFAISLLVSCQKESIEDLKQVDQIELSEKNDLNVPQHRAPNTGGTVCYEARLNMDYNCIGDCNAGWNETTPSASGCETLLAQMIATAQANGWCYEVPAANCGMYIGTCR